MVEDNASGYGEAVPSGESPHPGDIIKDGDALISPEPLVGRDASTPLDDDEPEGIIPNAVLWPMKDRRHTQWHLLPHSERHDRLRQIIGSGTLSVYVIDDGKSHATVGRLVGSAPDGAQYSLIGRITREELAAVTANPAQAFDNAAELLLVGVVEEEEIKSSNIFDVARYNAVDEIPADYLPGSPLHKFRGDLEITIY